MNSYPFTSLKNRITSILFACLFIHPATASSWQQVVDKDNLTIYQRPYRQSPLYEIKGVTRVKSSLNALVALFRDADFNQQWVYRSGGAKILSQANQQQAYVYGVVNAPWPMQNRDAIIRFDFSQNQSDKVITITLNNFPNYIAKKHDLVRVPDFGGYWQLKPLSDGWVEITYQVHGDPGGWVPAWLANKAAQRTVGKTLENIQWAARQYAHEKLTFVLEP